jgi:hypothetical protein
MKRIGFVDANGNRPELRPGYHREGELICGLAGASPSRHTATIRDMLLRISYRWTESRFLCVVAMVLFAALASTPVRAASVQSDQIDGSQIDQVGEQVMQGNEFRSVRRTVLDKLPETDIDKGFLQGALDWVGQQIGNGFDAIGDFFRWLFSGFKSPGTAAPPTAPSTSTAGSWNFGLGALSNVFTILMIALIAVVLIVIAAMIVKSIDARKRRQGGLLSDSDEVLSDVTTPPGELAASTYESRALQFASAGNYRAAIRELLLGSMSWIERAGLIRYRKGLTNRDYVRSVWRRADKREGYLTTASQFEFVYFGRRTPTAEMFELCLASFQGAFREEEAPTTAV